jgi:ABC-type multidrug transport system ATPase subunit
MEIRLEQIGKRFNRKWIIRHVDMDLLPGKSYVIRGSNGSGKSTILKLISGYLTPSEGTRLIRGEKSDQLTADHEDFTIVAPYLDLYTEMTLEEAISFHFSFKQKNEINVESLFADLNLPMHKSLKGFSSGMLQRVKLGLAFCTDSPCLLLDEPVMNLDEAGIQWFETQLALQRGKRTIVIASNDTESEIKGAEGTFFIDRGTVKKSS